MSHDCGCWKCGAETMGEKKDFWRSKGSKCAKYWLFKTKLTKE